MTSARATSTPITIPAIVPPDGIDWLAATAVDVVDDVAVVTVVVVCVDVLILDEELEVLVGLLVVDVEVLIVVEELEELELEELELEETTAACGIITHLAPPTH